MCHLISFRKLAHETFFLRFLSEVDGKKNLLFSFFPKKRSKKNLCLVFSRKMALKIFFRFSPTYVIVLKKFFISFSFGNLPKENFFRVLFPKFAKEKFFFSFFLEELREKNFLHVSSLKNPSFKHTYHLYIISSNFHSSDVILDSSIAHLSHRIPNLSVVGRLIHYYRVWLKFSEKHEPKAVRQSDELLPATDFGFAYF